MKKKKILRNNNFLCQKGMESVALHNQQVFNEGKKFIMLAQWKVTQHE